MLCLKKYCIHAKYSINDSFACGDLTLRDDAVSASTTQANVAAPAVGGRRRRQMPGGPAAEIPAAPADPAPPPTEAPTTTSSSSTATKLGASDPLTTTTEAAKSSESIDESAYKGYFDVFNCDKNQSFICVVRVFCGAHAYNDTNKNEILFLRLNQCARQCKSSKTAWQLSRSHKVFLRLFIY